jgi:hypothetical protein
MCKKLTEYWKQLGANAAIGCCICSAMGRILVPRTFGARTWIMPVSRGSGDETKRENDLQ